MDDSVHPQTAHISTEMLEQIAKVGAPESEANEVLNHLRVCFSCRCRVESWKFWGGFSGPDRDRP